MTYSGHTGLSPLDSVRTIVGIFHAHQCRVSGDTHPEGMMTRVGRPLHQRKLSEVLITSLSRELASPSFWGKTLLFLSWYPLWRQNQREGGSRMLRDRDEPRHLFALVPALHLAMEPVLTRLDTGLDDDTLLQTVKMDLARRFPRPPAAGRRRRWRAFCACGSSSLCRAGAMRRPSAGAAIAGCYGKAVASLRRLCPRIRPCSGGPT